MYRDPIYNKFIRVKYYGENGEVTEATMSANQAYNEAKKQGFKGSFKDFLQKTKESGMLDKGIEFFKGLFENEDQSIQEKPKNLLEMDTEEKKILGLNPIVFYLVTTFALVGIGYGFYNIISKKD